MSARWKAKSWVAFELCQPRLLQPHLVIVIQIVDTHDARALRQQRGGDVIADGACRAGQQDRHNGVFTRRSSSSSSTA